MQETAPVQPIRIDPFGNRIIVRLVNVEEKVHAIHTDTIEKMAEFGVVEEIGPSVQDSRVEKGAVVMFGKFSGYGVVDEETVMIREEDIIGRVHGGHIVSRKKERLGDSLVLARPTALINPAAQIQ